jgi:DNA transposition AAA+ family ATPase
MSEIDRPKLRVVGESEYYDESLRLWFEMHLAENSHLTTNGLARLMGPGVSRSILDAYLKKIYFKSEENPAGVVTSKLEDKIRKYKEGVTGSPRGQNQIGFTETTAWLQFQYACYVATKEDVITVVYGDPGIGKTTCLREYSYRKQTAAPIKILCSPNITSKHFASKLAKELKIDKRMSLAELEDAIAEKLAKYPRAIMIDQVNYLDEKALGTICYIWEVARIPIVLIGTQDLYDLFTRTRLTQDVRSQLSSRVAMHFPLENLSPAEQKTIIEKVVGSNTDSAFVQQIMKLTRGNFRHLSFIFPRIEEIKKLYAEQIANGSKTEEDVIETAGQRLMVV